MSHEISETRRSGLGGYTNVYGRGTVHSNVPLPPSWGFEQQTYPTLGMADTVAAARSNMFGMLLDSLNNQYPQARRFGLPVPFSVPITPTDQIHAVAHSATPFDLRTLIAPPNFRMSY